jgi:hypothetical protein
MRNKKIGVALGTLIVAAALIALPLCFPAGTLSSVHGQVQHRDDDREGCSLETLNGRYGLTFHGFAASPAPSNTFIPVAGAGIVSFDGRGNLSISETVSFGGQILPLELPGTYTVNSDCTGSLTTGNDVHLNLVIVRDGREILAINADPGRVAVDNFVKQ